MMEVTAPSVQCQRKRPKSKLPSLCCLYKQWQVFIPTVPSTQTSTWLMLIEEMDQEEAITVWSSSFLFSYIEWDSFSMHET